LTQKKENPIGLDDYRPISLVGCEYNIISKVLANKLKRVLPRIMDRSKLAFLKDRGMLDSVSVANEVIEESMRSKESIVIVKVDYEKAYDSVD